MATHAAPRQALGRTGEKLAARHLEEAGFRLLARNQRMGRMGELDLVAWAQDGRTLCFIEVKTRTSARYGTPAEAVTAVKRERIRRMAQVWLSKRMPMGLSMVNSPEEPPIRFDVVEVEVDRLNRSAHVHHIPDAF